MIARYWSATISKDKAPEYAHHLTTSVLQELKALNGFEGGKLLQRDIPGGVEVVVITFWKSLDAIRGFAGDDIEAAVVADKAASLLIDFNRTVRHYDVIDLGTAVASNI